MKQMVNCISKVLSTMIIFFVFPVIGFAQKNVEVNGNDVGSWFSRNWMWISGVIVVLLLLLLFSGGGKKRKTTIIEKDNMGDTKTITKTEEK
jgi:hypothetical protein